MKLLVFPKDPNPYQDLLYGQLGDRVDLKYIKLGQKNIIELFTIMPRLLGSLLAYRLQGFKAMHIHWVYPMFVSQKVPLHRLISYLYVRAFYLALGVLNFRIVWTVHDVVPQDPRTSNDERLMRSLPKLADAKIVHSENVITDMESHGLDTSNVTVIPHGSYVGVYPDTTTPDEARAKLGVPAGTFVVLFFGIISPYKGVDKLLQAISELNAPNVKFIIAGACVDETLRQQITQAAGSADIDFYDGHVPDDQVEVYFKAADVVCLPFSVITTSGSIILAFSFGKPVIAPRMGGLNDIPQNTGLYYDPEDKAALSKTLSQAIASPSSLAALGANAKTYASTISWDKIANKTFQVYQSAFQAGAASGDSSVRPAKLIQ